MERMDALDWAVICIIWVLSIVAIAGLALSCGWLMLEVIRYCSQFNCK